MVSLYDQAWVDAVCRECDPVFAAAQVGFERQVVYAGGPQGPAAGILWEADPATFAARFPDSGIVEMYGNDQWADVGCIDWWVNLHDDPARARLSLEGWNLPELSLPLTGRGEADGRDLAQVFARLLAVPVRDLD